MKILLLSMPGYFQHMPPVAVRMPSGALTWLACNIDSPKRNRGNENCAMLVLRENNPLIAFQ